MFPHIAILSLSLLAFAPNDPAPGEAPAPRAVEPSARSEARHRTLSPSGRATLGPVPSAGDAADDPAIWVHPSLPERSLVLATDKRGGLLVYRFDGALQQVVADGSRPNNVDILYDFELGGVHVDLAIASCRSDTEAGVKVWVIEPSTRRLVDAGAHPVFSVFSGRRPYGLCTYRSYQTRKAYFIVTHESGHVEQYELYDANGTVGARQVRAFRVRSTAEGCVADNEHGALYIAEEDVGIWKIDAEPSSKAEPKLIAKVGDHDLAAEVEGLALYCASGGKGYLIASSQGNNSLKVYDRGGDHRFLFTIDPRAGRHDDVEETDGVAVTNLPTSRQFPKGVLVMQDGVNADGRQDFHLYSWEDVAGDRLIVDTEWSPRDRRRR